MLDERDMSRVLERVRRLKQSDDVWEGPGRLGRMWITPHDRDPYRPYINLFVNQKGSILHLTLLDEAPTSKRVFEELLRAMQHPLLGSGRARRPKIVYLNSSNLVADLAPRLAPLGIRCEQRHPLPTLQATLEIMETDLSSEEPIPGLSELPFATPPLIGHLYALAADFYRAAPWRWLDDGHPIEIRCPSTDKPRYAVVMGSGGEIFGLAAYDTLDDLSLMYRDDIEPRQALEVNALAFWFDNATGINFDDLDARAEYDWPVAAEDAYPFWTRSKGGELAHPTQTDLFWMEGALAGILTCLREHKSVRLGSPEPAEMVLPVKTISGEIQVYLRFLAID